MLTILRNFYIAGILSGTQAVAAAIGSTLINGDILLYATTKIQYGSIVNGALVLATD